MAKKKKSKKPTLAKLKKKLQGIFNLYVRNRDKLTDGSWICISCGKKTHSPNASHYANIAIYPHMRFDERNVNASCIQCNLRGEGNLIGYRLGLLKKLGEDNLLQLEDDALNSTHTFTRDEILELIDYYKKKNDE